MLVRLHLVVVVELLRAVMVLESHGKAQVLNGHILHVLLVSRCRRLLDALALIVVRRHVVYHEVCPVVVVYHPFHCRYIIFCEINFA